MSMHFVMQIRAGGRHVLSTHLTYHAHTITEMQQGKPAAHTHTHTQGMARDSYLSNRLFTYFATLQQLSTVNDTLKRAIHGGSSFLSTHGYVCARDGSGTPGRGFHQIYWWRNFKKNWCATNDGWNITKSSWHFELSLTCCTEPCQGQDYWTFIRAKYIPNESRGNTFLSHNPIFSLSFHVLIINKS